MASCALRAASTRYPLVESMKERTDKVVLVRVNAKNNLLGPHVKLHSPEDWLEFVFDQAIQFPSPL